MTSIIQDLKSRGLIAQTTDIEALDALLNEQKIALYCGFDPTADSLHIGHLLPVLALRRFQQAGHTPIALVGGATGMIGDPSFKAVERSLNSAETVAGWVESILTRRLHQKQVFGLTLPLVTKSDGTKFGKTEGGAVWLNAKKTSPYQFYQFWLKVADADVHKFLKYFTFLSIEEIDAIEAKDKASGTKPEAQRILAEEMTCLIHGEAALQAAQRISESLFAEDQSSLTESDFEQLALDGLPAFEVSDGINVVEALVKTGLASSNKEARGFVNSKAVLLNGKPAETNNPNHAAERPDDACLLTDDHKRFGKYTIVRRGKRNHALLVWK